MSKVLLVNVYTKNDEAAPFTVTCKFCGEQPILVFVEVPLHRKLYMGRCNCAIYYWCDVSLPIEHYSRYMYYRTVPECGFTRFYNGVSKHYRPVILSNNIKYSLILETVEVFQNPFSSLSEGRAKSNYRRYFYNELNNPKFREAVLSLEGKKVYCPNTNNKHYSHVIKDWFMAGCVENFYD